ncbi:hypothetical protein VTO42DRAFT_4177 [Malbranchea cinnamomea]
MQKTGTFFCCRDAKTKENLVRQSQHRREFDKRGDLISLLTPSAIVFRAQLGVCCRLSLLARSASASLTALV